MVTRSLKFPPSLLQGPNCTTSMSKVTVEPEVTAGNWFVISFPFTNTAPETISRSDNISHFLYILTCKTTSLYFLQANREVTLVHLGTGCNNCEQEEICDLTKDFYLHIHESCSCVQQGSEEPGAVGLGEGMLWFRLTISADAHGFVPLQRVVAVPLLHAHPQAVPAVWLSHGLNSNKEKVQLKPEAVNQNTPWNPECHSTL